MSAPPWKRSARIAALGIAWIAVGAALNLLVTAWIVYFPVSPLGPGAHWHDEAAAEWPIPGLKDLPKPVGANSVRNWCETYTTFASFPAPRVNADGMVSFSIEAFDGVEMVDTAIGFPFRSFHRVLASYGLHQQGTRFETEIALPFGRIITVPTGFLWPGFALNTLFYALIAFALYQLPLALRRHQRRRTNRCPTCGYPRTSIPPQSPCPECGISPRS